ncbi:Glucoside xylosyltransferase 1 [Bulinus truncatus]|nr:Glucoside xylosyltransferase 1 [Bulinus truncatus]
MKEIELTQKSINDHIDKLEVQNEETPHLLHEDNEIQQKRKTNDEINAFIFKQKNMQPVFQGRSYQQTTEVTVHLCVVVCGEREEETMVMLKSAALVTPISKYITFHIVAETASQKYFKDQLEMWPEQHRRRLAYFIYNISFPDDDTSDSWKNLFKPCASQRLFLPKILESVDSLIYVDTDTLFLRSLSDLWSHFSQMNQSQLAGVVSEAEDGTAGWYNRFANHPYYGQYGVNSGVMLMNLTRMRQTTWLTDMQTFYKKYKMVIPWGDQDLINIFFSAHPDQLYLMSCPWNYRSDHCKYMSNCREAEQEGVFVVHGSRRMFYDKRETTFATVFEAFKDYQLGDDVERNLLRVLESKFLDAKPSNCGKVSYIFLTQLKKLFDGQEHSVKEAHKVAEPNLVEEIRADMIDDQMNLREENDDNLKDLPQHDEDLGTGNKESLNAMNDVNKLPRHSKEDINAAISNYQNDAYDYYENEALRKNEV